MTGDTALWIFGYGSLIFKPPPHTVEARKGYVLGFKRRFWQSSSDHRGTPEFPGRVVTLIDQNTMELISNKYSGEEYDSQETEEKAVALTLGQKQEYVTWGVCYRIDATKVSEVLSYLDIREQDGYSGLQIPFYSVGTFLGDDNPSGEVHSEPSVISALAYIGTHDNPSFLGPVKASKVAERIVAARGPSGENKEYLFKLEESLAKLAPEALDSHISVLADRVRELEKNGMKQTT